MKTSLPMMLLKREPLKAKGILFLLFWLVFTNTNLHAQNEVDMILLPSSSNVQVNQTFTVAVRVDFGTGSLAGADAYVNFDPLDLEVVSTPTVPANTQTGLPNTTVAFSTVATMNATGNVDHGRFTFATIDQHLNADFDLFIITFRALRVPPGGNTLIALNTAIPRQTAAGEFGQPDALDATVNATVNITSCVPPTATITASTGLSICNSQPVTLNLSAATGASPYDLTINGITYNNITVGSSIATIPFPNFEIFPSDPVPSTGTQFDGQPVTVAMKFTSSQAGFIKGLRFYRNGVSGGTYKLILRQYAAPSAELASVTATSPGLNEWQDLTFTTPVPIVAGTVYVVMIHSTNGRYVSQDNGLSSAVTNGPLTALANAPGSPNSMYYYGDETALNNVFTAGGFNDFSSFAASYYFMDVMFTSNTNSFSLTSVMDNGGCEAVGSPLQLLNVTSVDCSTLPVNLLNLSASPVGNKVVLKWTTASEINNRGFDIQRSHDGSDWTTVGFVAGVGNTSMQSDYSFTDHNLESRRYFYRLKQIDFDDRYKMSTIVSAVIGSRAEYSLGQNYPNPFNNQTTIQYVLPQREDVLLTLHDAGGRLVKVLVNGRKDSGTHAINFTSNALSKGVYYYKIVAGDFINMKKMVIY